MAATQGILTNTHISVALLNVRSILSLTKRLLLTTQLIVELPEIVCLTETWLDKFSADDSVFLNSPYTVISRTDRSSGPHGGVVIGALPNANASLSEVPIVNQFDFGCAVLVRTGDYCFIIATIYLPPKDSNYRINANSLTEFITEVSNYLKKYALKHGMLNTDLYLVGDLNLPHTD